MWKSNGFQIGKSSTNAILGYMIFCGKQSWLGVTINMISNTKFHKPILGMVYTVYYWVCHIVWYSQPNGFIGVQTTTITKQTSISLDWLKGKFTGKPHVEWENRWLFSLKPIQWLFCWGFGPSFLHPYVGLPYEGWYNYLHAVSLSNQPISGKRTLM